MRPFLALVFSMCLFGCNDTVSPADTAVLVDAPVADAGDDAATCTADGGCGDMSVVGVMDMPIMDSSLIVDGGSNG